METGWLLHCMEQSELVALKNASLLESVWDQVGVMCLRVCVGLVLSAALDYRSQGLYWREISIPYTEPRTTWASIINSNPGRNSSHGASKVKVKVTQLCLTLCDPMDYRVHWILQARILEWVKPFPSPGDLPNLGIEPRSPMLQADSLPAEPPGKPKNTGVGSLSLLQWIFLHCSFLTSWASREVHGTSKHLLIFHGASRGAFTCTKGNWLR